MGIAQAMNKKDRGWRLEGKDDESYLGQAWDMLMGRGSGPLGFRFVIQPLVATALGIRAGLKDARAGRPVYGWTVVTQSGTRSALLLEVGRCRATFPCRSGH